ncbi:MAG TPA: cytochrome c [Terriglobales bacterium]|nr:cytochrome c [Terriglobales bacterium]
MTRRPRYACCAGLAFCWFGAAAILCQKSPNTVRNGSPKSGSVIFRKSCSVCHSVHKGETKVGPSLYGELREGSGHSEEHVRQVIIEGQGTMPPFKEKLDSEQMDDLIAYLKTL